ncbi:MAG: hydrogenase-4 transcriptional activator [Verrucomicrobiota bacterium]
MLWSASGFSHQEIFAENVNLRPECPEQTRCLHLVASAGRPLGQHEDWPRLNGTFRRIPLGANLSGAYFANSLRKCLIDGVRMAKNIASRIRR